MFRRRLTAAVLLVARQCALVASQHGGNLAGAGRAAWELFQHLQAMQGETTIETTSTTTTLHHFVESLPVGEQAKHMIGAIAGDCQKIPADVSDQWRRSQCNANVTETVEIVGFMMTSMKQPSGYFSKEQELALEKRSQLMQARMHSLTERFCIHPECLSGLKLLVQHNSECFADAVCTSMSHALPFEVCRPLMRQVLVNTAEAEIDAMCVVEPGTDMYCPEMNTLLMTKHFDCWSQMHQPEKGCSPECKIVWSGFRRKYPTCSTEFAEQVARSQSMTTRMFNTAGVRGLSNLITRSHHEVCSDLGATSQEEEVLSSVVHVAEAVGTMQNAGKMGHDVTSAVHDLSSVAGHVDMGKVVQMGSALRAFHI